MKSQIIILILGLITFRSHGQVDSYTEYISSSQWNTLNRWINKDDKLDSCGVITRKSQYNPVTIFQYALVNYDLYGKTGDTSYLNKFLTQVEKYALNNERYITVQDSMIGYPYHYNYGSLKAPWYSGMSQGYAISVLLRYHSLTGKKEVLEIVKKVRNLMLTMVPLGTLNYSDDGCTWIEEYPDPKKKQVLNGFFISYVGLFEYCKAFPEDERANRILSECYESISAKNLHYQRNDWLIYSSKQGNCTNGYMKFQIIEMKHLYELTGDDYFNRQMAIWATFSDGRKIKNSFNGGNIYFGKPMAYKGKINSNLISSNLERNLWLTTSTVDSIHFNGYIVLKDHPLLDGDTSTKTTLTSKRNTIQLHFNQYPQKHHLVLEQVNLKKVKFHYLNESKEKWVKVKQKNLIELSASEIDLSNMPSRHIKIDLKNEEGVELKDIKVKDLEAYDRWLHILYQKSNKVEVKEESVLDLEYELADCKDFYIFYKYGENIEEFNKQKWDADFYVHGKGPKMKLKKGVYEFLITARINGPLPSITLGEDVFNVILNPITQ